MAQEVQGNGAPGLPTQQSELSCLSVRLLPSDHDNSTISVFASEKIIPGQNMGGASFFTHINNFLSQALGSFCQRASDPHLRQTRRRGH